MIQLANISKEYHNEKEIWKLIERLPQSYQLFPECRYLPTKSKKYRWIILDAHLIIYRIAKNDVHVYYVYSIQKEASSQSGLPGASNSVKRLGLVKKSGNRKS